MSANHLFAIAIVSLFVFIVGSMDYEDKSRERALYCDMVQKKVWPDYKEIYSKECPNNR